MTSASLPQLLLATHFPSAETMRALWPCCGLSRSRGASGGTELSRVTTIRAFERAQAALRYKATRIRLQSITRAGHLELLRQQPLASWRAFIATGANLQSITRSHLRQIFLPSLSSLLIYPWTAGENETEIVDESTGKQVCKEKGSDDLEMV